VDLVLNLGVGHRPLHLGNMFGL